jgi:addiction module HigA family antidote
MALFDPAHPGALIRETLEGIFEETGQKLTVSEVAEGLGTTRKTLSAIINERQSVTPEMAVRLGAAFPHTSAEFWLTVQENYDLAKARRKVDTSRILALWQPKKGMLPT